MNLSDTGYLQLGQNEATEGNCVLQKREFSGVAKSAILMLLSKAFSKLNVEDNMKTIGNPFA